MPELGQLPLSEEASTLVRNKRHLDVRVPSWHLSDPRPLRGLHPSGSEVISMDISQTVAPPTASSQNGASQNVEAVAMVQDLVKSFSMQLEVIPQETPDQSQAQSDSLDPEHPQISYKKTSPLRGDFRL